MQVLVNSDNHIEASQDFINSIGARVGDKIASAHAWETRSNVSKTT